MWLSCSGNVEDMKKKIDEYNAKSFNAKSIELNQLPLDEALRKIKELDNFNLREKELLIRERLKADRGGADFVGPVPLTFAEGGAFSESLGVNGVLRTPTLLSQGIFGEAGDEALISSAHRSMAVPLTNEKAWETPARMIADYIGSRGGGDVHYDIYIDGTLWNNKTLTEETVEDFIKTVARKGNMNCG